MKSSKIIGLGLILSVFSANAQELSISSITETELSKEARTGLYGGTIINGDQAQVYYVFKNDEKGTQVEQYNLSIGGSESSYEGKFLNADEASAKFDWYMPPSKVENIAGTEGDWIEATAAFAGSMKLNRGKIIKHYRLGVFTGISFQKEESIKPKAGDIWRISPGGYKSLSDIDRLATENNFYKELKKYGKSLHMPAKDKILAAGVITEKVSLKKDQKYAHNRVGVLTIDGSNFDNMDYDIYLLPYTAITINSGLGQDGMLTSLFTPLNGPTTLASLKHLYWKDKKNVFTVMRFSDDRKLVDSVSFRSKLMWGDFDILDGNGSTYIVGKGNGDFDGWFRGLQYTKLNALQITKVKDGRVVYNTFLDKDVIADKIKGAQGEKVKFKPILNRGGFNEIVDLPNGDALAIGQSALQVYILHMSPNGEVKALYYLPAGKEGESALTHYQYQLYGDDLIFVTMVQPVEFSTDAKVTVKSYTAGYSKITETSVSKLNEVFLQTYVYKINTNSANVSNKIAMDGKEFYTMGSFPAMFTEGAVYFTGRDKGPKGKKIFVAKIGM